MKTEIIKLNKYLFYYCCTKHNRCVSRKRRGWRQSDTVRGPRVTVQVNIRYGSRKDTYCANENSLVGWCARGYWSAETVKVLSISVTVTDLFPKSVCVCMCVWEREIPIYKYILWRVKKEKEFSISLTLEIFRLRQLEGFVVSCFRLFYFLFFI